jgi:CheY-like chemotaxis protein
MDFLVIDDDKTFRDATCLLIEEEGHYAQPSATGEAGLANLKEDKFDAVLLDVNLGAENGLDVLDKIQKSNRRKARSRPPSKPCAAERWTFWKSPSTANRFTPCWRDSNGSTR